MHRALAEGLPPQDQAPLVILDGAGEDFRGGGRKAIHQHGEGPFPGHLPVFIIKEIDPAAGAANLHRGARFNEEPREGVGFLKGAAAIIAKVDDNAVHRFAGRCVLGLRCLRVFAAQRFNQALHVPGGALVFRISLLKRFEVDVEGGDVDHPDAVGVLAPGYLDDFALSRLLFELYGLPHQAQDPGRGPSFAIRRKHFKAHRGARGASNEVHDVIKAPAHHVHKFPVFPLGHGADAIGRLNLLALLRRPRGDQACDGGVFVLDPQYGANALEGQAHLNVEVLRGARRKVLRVGVVACRQSVHEQLKGIFSGGLLQTVQAVTVALLE